MNTARGITLIEVMVAVAIVSILAALSVPTLMQSMATSRSRAGMNRFLQDVAWVRGQAITGSHACASIAVSVDGAGNCTWTATVDGVSAGTLAAHSSNAGNGYPGGTSAALSCTGGASPATTLPVTIAFNSQGMLQATGTCSASASSASVLFTSSSTQAWQIQLLGSGSALVIQ